MESPYQVLLADQLGPEATAELADDQGVCLVAAAQPSGGVSNHEVWARVGTTGDFAQAVAFGEFSGYAELASDIGPASGTLPIIGALGLARFTAGRLAALVSPGRTELVLVQSVSPAALTVKRGMVDTTPAVHAAGAKLFSLAETTTYIDDARADGQAVQVRVLTESPKGKLPLAGAPTDSVTFASRQVRPYPPGRLRLNGQVYPAAIAAASVTAQVAHRDRIAQGAQLVDQDATSIGPEPGTTLTFRWYLNGALARTEAGVTGTSDSFTPAGNGTVRVEVEAVRDGHASWQALSHQFAFEVTP